MIGTHNSMSYLRPTKWYARLFNFMSKCQDIDIHEQLKKVDCVDLRVYYDYKDKDWKFAHGIAKYDYNLKDILGYINSNYLGMRVRLILEKINRDKIIETQRFTNLCYDCINTYNRIIFIGSNRKVDWFKCCNLFRDEDMIQPISSMAKNARWYERFWPRLYAKRNNKNIKHNNKEIVLCDFIDKYR